MRTQQVALQTSSALTVVRVRNTPLTHARIDSGLGHLNREHSDGART